MRVLDVTSQLLVCWKDEHVAEGASAQVFFTFVDHPTMPAQVGEPRKVNVGALDASQHSLYWATIGQRHFGAVITLVGQQANCRGIVLVANLKNLLFVQISTTNYF